MLFPIVALSIVLALGGSSAVSSAPDALDAFATAWSKIDAYSATFAMHETVAKDVQDRTYALTFAKPSNATIVITKGPGRGGKVVWSGGDSVIASPPGLFSHMKVQLGIGDARVTALRGDTVAMASFGWILDHFRQTAGAKTESVGPGLDANATTLVSLAVADPSADEGLTQEVLVIANATELPLSVRSYIGPEVVKEVRFSDVTVLDATPPSLTSSRSPGPSGN
jgi:outer membrane lipoprotein-sorting protein